MAGMEAARGLQFPLIHSEMRFSSIRAFTACLAGPFLPPPLSPSLGLIAALLARSRLSFLRRLAIAPARPPLAHSRSPSLSFRMPEQSEHSVCVAPPRFSPRLHPSARISPLKSRCPSLPLLLVRSSCCFRWKFRRASARCIIVLASSFP